MHLKRTHTCGQLRQGDIGEEVILNGWIHAKREHGGVIFIDLRDRYGKTQVVYRPDATFDKIETKWDELKEAWDKVGRLGLEDVIAVRGEVVPRPKESLNPDLPTGEIDVLAAELKVLNEAEPLPL